jgi:ATP-binding protein involved in chromosome partitioning
MENNVSVDTIKSLMGQVMHPAINSSLHELGIVKNVDMQYGKAVITMALPFPNIPILDQLVSSVKEPIEKLGVEVTVEQTLMSQEEVQHFLQVEQANWKGGLF